MPYKQHWRIVCNGTAYGEKISFGVSCVGDGIGPGPGFGDLVSLNSVLTQAKVDFTSFLGKIGPYCGTSVKWDGLRVTEYNDSGDISGVAETNFASQISGSNSSNLPGWVSLCVTCLTDRPGRKFRGRVYLPLLVSTSNIGLGQWGQTIVDMYTNSFGQLLGDINNAPGYDTIWNGLKCCVSSKGGLQAQVPGSGHNTVIKRVRGNSLVDTQRRRGNDQVATATTMASVAGS